MKAVVLRRFGGAAELRPEERPEPVAAADGVVVELRAAALNWHDCLVRRGAHQIALPRVIGADGAGIRSGSGEEVVIFPSLWWGDDETHPGPDFEILGDHRDGTYAEQVAVPAANVFPKPAAMSWEEAAAVPLAAATAYRALFSRGGLREGETVLVLGAGGGVATMAIGLARMAGARILVTSSRSDKLACAGELGADGGALSTDADWPAQVREMSGGGVDLVVDSIGSTWPRSLEALRDGGRLVSFGASGGERAEVAIRPFYFGQYSILGTTMASPCDFAGLLDMLAANPGWRPMVDTVLPLERASAAHELLERHDQVGKIVLRVG